MDSLRVAALRETLAGTGWLEATRCFAGALRSSLSHTPRNGFLLVGGESYEPWHLAAHLDDEAAWCGLPELSPTLVRRRVPPGAPPHLAVDLSRLEAASRGETLLVVTPDPADEALLERVHGARRTGATVFAMEGGDAELRSLAHDALTESVHFDVLQHLVSAAAGESTLPAPERRHRRGGFRGRLARLAEQLTTPPPSGW